MIHPTAIVSPGAVIGNNVSIGPYSLIGDDVTIGDDVEIAGHVSISGPTSIGSRNRIYPFASLGQAPQDLKYAGEPTTLQIGSDNVIREFVTMNRGTVGGGGATVVGDSNLFMTQAHVAHDCKVGSFNIFANAASLAGHVDIFDHITLGAFVGVHQFCRIGSYAFIGGMSKVVQDALPYARSDGHDPKCYGANTIGLRRKGFSNEAIRDIQKAFRLLLTSKLNTSQALERIEAEIEATPEIAYLVEFIRKSERGVIK